MSCVIFIFNIVRYEFVKYAVLFALAAFVLFPGIGLPASHAIVPGNLVPESDVAMKKVEITMNIPQDPKLPFGCVWGTVQNAAPGYPVEIEIYKNSKPVYFAQANVTSDGAYQHYFRVANTVNGHETNIFEGTYTVDIFKYVVSPAAQASTQA